MYSIYYGGQFLAKKAGWGLTFTCFSQDAKRFKSPQAAQNYINEYLPDFGASVVYNSIEEE